MSDSCTLVRGEGLACKLVTQAGIKPASKDTWFQAQSVPVGSLQEMVVLLGMVVQDQRMFLVRGTPREEHIRRTHVGQDAYLRDTPHHWLALDLDSVKPDLKPDDFAASPVTYAAWARAQLPAAWVSAACWWQATGSAGIKPGLRLRLVFWLSRPLDSRQAKTMAKSLPLPCDLSLFTPSQPHYTARPVFGEGVQDPIRVEHREGMLPGLPEVILSELDQPELERACTKIAKAEEGERRNTLNAQAFLLARTTDIPVSVFMPALCKASTLPESEAQECAQVACRDGRSKRLQDLDGWRAELARDKSGEPRATPGNVALYVLNHPAFAGKLAMDGTRFLWTEPPPWDPDSIRPWQDSDAHELMLWFQTQAGLSVTPAWCTGACELAASRVQVCEVQEYLASLPAWDGQARMDTFFVRHWGVQDTRLVRAQSRIWLIQAARRAWATLDAPVNAQYMIVLQGPGGLRKSLGLRAMCKKQTWFRDLVPDLRDKDSSLAMLDSWIVELAELTHKRADQDVVKAFLTRSVEKFRPPYGRATILAPRRCALIGTCNETTFLTDPTGNRRYWPMVCTRKADLSKIEAERDQLWAEAQAHQDEQAWLPDDMEQEAAMVQDEHRDPSTEELIQERLIQALSEPRFAPDMGMIGAGEVQDGRLLYVSYRLICALAGLDPLRSGAQVGRAMGGLGWTRIRVRIKSGTYMSSVARYEIPEGLRPHVRQQTRTGEGYQA